jgi:hypothetical protein
VSSNKVVKQGVSPRFGILVGVISLASASLVLLGLPMWVQWVPMLLVATYGFSGLVGWSLSFSGSFLIGMLLQGLWLSYFLHTGRSTVTGSTLSFHVRHERV